MCFFSGIRLFCESSGHRRRRQSSGQWNRARATLLCQGRTSQGRIHSAWKPRHLNQTILISSAPPAYYEGFQHFGHHRCRLHLHGTRGICRRSRLAYQLAEAWGWKSRHVHSSNRCTFLRSCKVPNPPSRASLCLLATTSGPETFRPSNKDSF
ncbi:Uncharacterised protein [uncultured archaeon]|nr:Uncharacterised protein [uncultured archaeon]